MAINRLSSIDELSAGDSFPVYSVNSGDDRRVPLSVLAESLKEDLPVPTGLLDISSYYIMRIPGAVSVPIGTSFQNIPNYTSQFTVPANRASVTANTILGEFVAARDIEAIEFTVGLVATWPVNRELSLAVYVGTDALPFESAFKFVGEGKGGSSTLSANFNGPTSNINNPGGIIKAGEKIRLVARFNIADTLNIQRLSFVVKTCDGQ